MRVLLLFSFCLLTTFVNAQATTVNITSVANMPMKISNNAVVEGWINGTPYVFSFGGIDTTKIWSGITQKSFRYNTVTDVWDTIPPLPDTMGKIASAASYVDSIIYIIGGYHVLSNSNEISSSKVHRYDPRTNSYLTDGSPVPVPIDDQVQAVWNDSLIYVITGWSNSGNVPNVQIYDPANDNWITGTSVPNNNTYKAFGASGVIIGNTIYYHGGASTVTNFPAQSTLRIGLINPSNPSQITWSTQPTGYYTYRSGCTDAFGYAHWLGGSEITYNFNGIAYNGSGGVPTKTTNLNWINNSFDTVSTTGGFLPMDLRGVASISTSLKYIVGGMENPQQVSNKSYKLNFATTTGIDEKNDSFSYLLFPNPCSENVYLQFDNSQTKVVRLVNVVGKEYLRLESNDSFLQLNVADYPKGIYFVTVETEKSSSTQKIVIQ